MALGQQALIQLARIAIPTFIEEGLSANKALSTLIARGEGIRRQTFYQLWRQARAFDDLKAVWPRIDPQKTLTPTQYALSDRNLAGKYVHVYEVPFFDTLDGSPLPRTVAVYSDRRLSLEEAESRVIEVLESAREKYLFEGAEYDDLSELRFIGAFVRSGTSRREVTG